MSGIRAKAMMLFYCALASVLAVLSNIEAKKIRDNSGHFEYSKNSGAVAQYSKIQNSSSVVQFCKSGNVASVTFDDSQGGSNVITSALAAHKVRAVFHVTSATLVVPGKEQEFQNLIGMGHEVGLQIINITNQTDYADVMDKVKAGLEIFKHTLGKAPRFVRFPYGYIDSKVISEVSKLGCIVTTTSIDSMDYNAKASKDITSMVKIGALEMKSNKKGPIVVFRDTTQFGPEAVDSVIKELKSIGFEVASLAKCVGVSEFSKGAIKGPSGDKGGNAGTHKKPPKNNSGKKGKAPKNAAADDDFVSETSGCLSVFARVGSSILIALGFLVFFCLF